MSGSFMPGYPCETCGRQSNGITITMTGKTAMFCTKECARDYMRHDGDLTKDEVKAAIEGGYEGGEYLDGIGIFDLRQLSQDQWATFCGMIYRGTCTALRKQADDEIPF